MTRYLVVQPGADSPSDLANAVLTEYTGTPQEIACGYEPGSYRVGVLDWAEPVEVPTVNLFLNTPWAGTVDGTLGSGGAIGTAWSSAGATGGIALANEIVTVTAVAQRPFISQSKAVLANTTYHASVEITTDTALALWQILAVITLPSAATVTFQLDNSTVAGSTNVGPGSATLGVTIAVGETAGTPTIRMGAGVQSNVTAVVTLTKPQFEVGTVRSAYQRIVATS